ncbi:MAG TPA: DNA repair protein RadA, partial [Rhodospirillaceae bacterium]|nr:DNA repair protein RadA [Rhodospirillaceae bacterium]
MAKSSSHYVCQTCGASFPKWGGKCEACGAWNTLVEEAVAEGPPKGLHDGSKGKHKGRAIA